MHKFIFVIKLHLRTRRVYVLISCVWQDKWFYLAARNSATNRNYLICWCCICTVASGLTPIFQVNKSHRMLNAVPLLSFSLPGLSLSLNRFYLSINQSFALSVRRSKQLPCVRMCALSGQFCGAYLFTRCCRRRAAPIRH